MHLVLVGPGALGSLFAVRLTPHLQKESDALFLLDYIPQRARKLARTGFTLHQNGNKTFSSPQVTADPQAISACEVLLLCVKASHVKKALHHASPLIKKNTLVIGMQNGMSHLAALQNTAGIAIAAVSSAGATLAAPGRVLYGGAGLTRFGLLDTNTPVPTALKALVKLFTKASLQAELVDDIRLYLWEKLFINVGINALTAIHGEKNGWLLNSNAIKNTMKKAVAEAVAIAKEKNIAILEDPVALTFSVCLKTKNNISSMLQDVQKKRPTEIDAINGYIVREGKRLGIPTPVNEELVSRVLEIEQSWQTTT